MVVMEAIALPAWAERELKIQIGGAGLKSPALLFFGPLYQLKPVIVPAP
jgi:hypothetical protein